MPSSRLKGTWIQGIVFIAIGPMLPGFGRDKHGMTGFMIVVGSMFVFRGIAAECFATYLAGAQVHPSASHGDTGIAFVL